MCIWPSTNYDAIWYNHNIDEVMKNNTIRRPDVSITVQLYTKCIIGIENTITFNNYTTSSNPIWSDSRRGAQLFYNIATINTILWAK